LKINNKSILQHIFEQSPWIGEGLKAYREGLKAYRERYNDNKDKLLSTMTIFIQRKSWTL
jgi:hypothetical protein